MEEKNEAKILCGFILIIFLFFLSLVLLLNNEIIAQKSIFLVHGILFFLLIYLVFIFYIARICKSQKVIFILLNLSFLLHCCVTFLNFSGIIHLDLPDLVLFQRIGNSYVEKLFSGDGEIISTSIGAKAYGNYFLGNAFLFFGRNPIIAGILNNLFYIFTCIIILKIGELLFSKYFDQNIAAFIVMIYPASYWFIPVPLRDAVFLFFCVISIFYLLRFMKNEKYKCTFLIYGTLFAILASILRPQMLPIFLGLYLIFIIFLSSFLYKRKIISFLLFSFIMGMFVIFYKNGTNLAFFSFLDIDKINVGYVNIYRRSLLNSLKELPLTYLPQITYNTWFDILKNLPQLFIYFFFSPFFWVRHNWQFMLASISSLFNFIILILIFINFVRFRDMRRIFLIAFLIILVLSSGFVIIEVNSGAAIRHAMPCVMLSFCLISLTRKNHKFYFSENYESGK